jgi:PTS system ascorbate-specific IIC component
MKYLGYIGFAICCVFLIIIPQLQYAKDKKNYFTVAEDWEAYKAATGAGAAD